MVLREQDKHFLWSLYMAVALIFAWKGVWEGIYELPYICDYGVCNEFVFLFIGFTMLTLSGMIFKEFDPLGGIEKAVDKVIHQIHHHPRRKEFTMKYYDKNRKKEVTINAESIINVEKGALVVKHQNQKQELFIPIHRVTEVLYQGKTYWKL